MKFALVLPLFALLANPAKAATPIQCQVAPESGWVTLEYNEVTKSGTQKMVSIVGQEKDWTKPATVMTLCEAIKGEIITSMAGEKLDSARCADDGSVFKYVYTGFQLTEKGASLLPIKSSVVWFGPEGIFNGKPVDASFKKTVKAYDAECGMRKE